MKINTITYSKTYQIGIANYEKVGLEAEVNETDNPETELLILKNLVEKFHKETNPEPQKKSLIPQKKSSTEEQMALDIEQVKDIQTLERIYKASADKSPVVKAAYDKRINELNSV